LGLAVGFIIYSIYTYDRIGDDRFKGSNKKCVLVIIALLSLIGFYIFAINGVILIALSSCMIGYLYGKEIKIGKHVLRLKGSYGIKNIVVGVVWALLTVGHAYSTKLIPLCLVFLFMFTKSFINSTINDFKDIQEDKLNGILTLPVSLGELQTRNFLIGILFFSNLVLYAAMLQGVIQINYIILFCSLVCGLLGIMTYKDTQSKFSKTIRDGEALITVLLVLISGSALTAFSL
jgi:4-hydroxybenzoate polyprenyltransferase